MSSPNMHPTFIIRSACVCIRRLYCRIIVVDSNVLKHYDNSADELRLVQKCAYLFNSLFARDIPHWEPSTGILRVTTSLPFPKA